MKPLIILNPNSQGGKTGEHADELERVIRRYIGEVERVHTEAPRHAVTIAQQAARDGRSAVIAVGGDGTIHEIANGLMKARAEGVALPKLGIVGQGTGGDFRKTLGLKHRLDKYCHAIALGTTRSIDMGKFSYTNKSDERDEAYFINILSMGMGGLVDEFVAESRGQLGGTLAYFSASARALFQSEVGILDCVVHDGGEKHEVEIATRQLAVCNGRYFGSGMEVAPMAKPDDGVFDVVSLGAAPKLKFALGSLAVYNGSHVDSADVEIFSCQRIDISLRNDSIRRQFPLDVDGEPLGTLPLSIEVVPGAIEVFAPLSGA